MCECRCTFLCAVVPDRELSVTLVVLYMQVHAKDVALWCRCWPLHCSGVGLQGHRLCSAPLLGGAWWWAGRRGLARLRLGAPMCPMSGVVGGAARPLSAVVPPTALCVSLGPTSCLHQPSKSPNTSQRPARSAPGPGGESAQCPRVSPNWEGHKNGAVPPARPRAPKGEAPAGPAALPPRHLALRLFHRPICQLGTC